jgi:hypothetical protein
MNHHAIIAALAILIHAPFALAEVVYFENTNPALNSLKLFEAQGTNPTLGQSLDITRSSFDQPNIGDLPGGSIFFMQLNGPGGDFIWLGMGRLTLTARSTIETLIPDPFAGQLVPYFGPTNFAAGEQINDSTNFIDGFRAMHGVNHLTDEMGIFTVEEQFAVALQFELADGVHFGFARFERSIEVTLDGLDIQWHPIDWGYETTAGVGIKVVPAPGFISMGLLIGLGITKRPKRLSQRSAAYAPGL